MVILCFCLLFKEKERSLVIRHSSHVFHGLTRSLNQRNNMRLSFSEDNGKANTMTQFLTKNTLIFFLFLTLLLGISGCSNMEFWKAKRLYNKGNFDASIPLFSVLAALRIHTSILVVIKEPENIMLNMSM